MDPIGGRGSHPDPTTDIIDVLNDPTKRPCYAAMERVPGYLLVSYLTFVDLIQLGRASRSMQSYLMQALEDYPEEWECLMENDAQTESSALLDLLAKPKRLKLSFMSKITDVGIRRVGHGLAARACCADIHLDLQKCLRASDFGLLGFLDLKITKLSACGVCKVTNSAMLEIIIQQSLRHLDVSRCYRISDVCVSEMRNLLSLDLSRCVNIVKSDTIVSLSLNNSELQSLKLNGLSGAMLEDAFERCKPFLTVRHLELDSVALSDKGLFLASTVFPNIETLNLARCLRLTSLKALGVKNVERIKILDLNGSSVPAGGVGLRILKHAKNLVDLDLRQTDVTDSGLACFSQKLQRIALSGTKITDFGLHSLSNRTGSASALREVLLGGCVHISPKGLTLLFEMHPNLTTVQLPSIATNAVLDAAAKGLRHLQTIDLGKSSALTSQVIESFVVATGGTLRVLRADETSINDECLMTIALSCSLEKFTAFGCYNTTVQGFDILNELASFKLSSVMDRDGRMLRCPCCRRRSTSTSCISSSKGGKSASLTLSGGDDANRFWLMEAPFLAIATAISVLWS